MYKDKVIICKDCGNSFVFSAAEQKFYAEKGFPHEPVRCPESPCDPPVKAVIFRELQYHA